MARPRRRNGRPRLLDGPKRETFLQAVRAGNRPQAAAEYAGISAKTVSEWLRRANGTGNRPGGDVYVKFARDMRQALAHAEVYAVTQVRGGMQREPRWATWWLENTVPEWRRSRESETLAALPPPSQTQNFVLIDGATLRRYAEDQLRAERGDADIDDATRARRARLVTDSAKT